jgi:aspartyl-tRNA(Asn)/glutamyl-tRNA(Gln) amidotransferase subunit A
LTVAHVHKQTVAGNPCELTTRLTRLVEAGFELDREEIVELENFGLLLDTYAQVVALALDSECHGLLIGGPIIRSTPDFESADIANPEGGAARPESRIAECLSRIAELNCSLRAFTSIYSEEVLQAERSARACGDLLLGMPVGIKDVIDVEGLPTSANSFSAGRMPVRRDAEVVRRLRDHGALIVGKTTTWEYGVGPNPAEGPYARARNPHGVGYQTGGSSSGSAVAVASGMVAGALGTDTGGSIRGPASWCGVVGFKPTRGLAPNDGVMPLAPSLDCAGVLARSVPVAAKLFEAITTVAVPHSGRERSEVVTGGSTEKRKAYRIAVWQAAMDASDTSAEVRENFDLTTKLLTEAGITICEARLPSLTAFNAACYLVARHESFSCYRNQLADREWRGNLNVPTRSLLLAGGMISTDEIAHADRLRVQLTEIADSVLAEFDAVITPTMAIVAPPVETGAGIMASPTPLFIRFASLTGGPSVTIPSGTSLHGLPFGLLLNGRRGSDRALLQLSAFVETVLARSGAAEAAEKVSS